MKRRGCLWSGRIFQFAQNSYSIWPEIQTGLAEFQANSLKNKFLDGSSTAKKSVGLPLELIQTVKHRLLKNKKV